MITTVEYLPALRQRHREKRIVFSDDHGVLLSKGYEKDLHLRQRLGNILIVGLSRDPSQKPNNEPLNRVYAELSRLSLAASSSIDYGFIMPEAEETAPDHTMHILEQLRPDFFVDSARHQASWNSQLAEINDLGVHVVVDYR